MAADQKMIAIGRLANARKWFAHRGWDVLPDNERGQRILQWGADHAWQAGSKNPKRSVRCWCRKWAGPWLTNAELDQIVRETEEREKRWSGDQSAAVLEIGVRDREHLRLWFFGADDDPNYDHRQQLKRAKDAARKRKSRAARSTGRPRGRPSLDLSPEAKAARVREQNAARQRRRRASRKKPSRTLIDINPVTHLSVTTPNTVEGSAGAHKRAGVEPQLIAIGGVPLAPVTGGCALAPPPPPTRSQFPPRRITAT